MDFIRTRKKRRFKETLQIITLALNRERQISVKRLIEKFGYTPDYCKKLLRWAAEILPYAEFDEETNTLQFIETAEPISKEKVVS